MLLWVDSSKIGAGSKEKEISGSWASEWYYRLY